MKSKRPIIVAASITATLLVIVSVVFAALTSTLNISFGNVTQNALRWNVGFKGSSVIPVQEGTSDTGLSCGIATVTSSTVTIADSTLSKPDDKCTYPLTIENTGDVSANLAAIAMSQPTNMTCNKPDDATLECGNITIKLKTESGADFTAGVTVEPGEEYDLNLIIHYTGTTLNSTPLTINTSKVTFAYKQAAKRASSVKPDGIKNAPQPVCKRATTLHTEECINDNRDYYCKGAGYYVGGSKATTTITYGNLGSGGILTVGDAFDCDVNGDGTYDSTNERFYYLTTNGDSNYVSMFFYNNVIGGLPSSESGVHYAETNNVSGPVTAYQQLPSTTQWSNVSLSNVIRPIYSASSNKLIVNFNYSDRASHLPNYNLLHEACGVVADPAVVGSLDNCIFLLENTLFSGANGGTSLDYWLENTVSNSIYESWGIYGDRRGMTYGGIGARLGVRPIIEVPLADISY